MAGPDEWLDYPQWRLQQPLPITFTYAADFPTTIKLKKKVDAWPLAIGLRLDYHRAAQRATARCTCKDAITGGRLVLNPAARELEYRKRVTLGQAVTLNVLGAWSWVGDRRPRLGVEVELRRGSAVLAHDAFLFKHTLPVRGPLALQVRGGMPVPMPSVQHAFGSDSSSGLQLEGNFHVFLREANLVISL